MKDIIKLIEEEGFKMFRLFSFVLGLLSILITIILELAFNGLIISSIVYYFFGLDVIYLISSVFLSTMIIKFFSKQYSLFKIIKNKVTKNELVKK